MAISALALVPSSVIAHHGSDAAKQAAADIQAAQDRANDASQAMFDAESDIDGLGIDIAATDMQDGLEAQAVRSFVGAGSGGDFDLFIDFDDSNDSNDSNDGDDSNDSSPPKLAETKARLIAWHCIIQQFQSSW